MATLSNKTILELRLSGLVAPQKRLTHWQVSWQIQKADILHFIGVKISGKPWINKFLETEGSEMLYFYDYENILEEMLVKSFGRIPTLFLFFNKNLDSTSLDLFGTTARC